MKRFLLAGILCCIRALNAWAQEVEPESLNELQQQLEIEAEETDTESEDDSYIQQLRQYLRNPLNINRATVEELGELRILTALQISSLISYRKLFGHLISIYELQAIPLWDLETIRKVLPYIIVAGITSLKKDFIQRLQSGDQQLLLRLSITVPKSKGFYRLDSITSGYAGSRPQVLIRYSYNHQNLLQYGLLAEKDAGEELFKGSQKRGFDFYSFHFFLRKSGVVKALALGDFTVNLGQGLIQWQRLAFKKSASIVSAKKQTSVLHAYHSPGEYNFYRGAGITLEKKRFECTLFASIRNLSASLQSDSVGSFYVSSVSKSGYHRLPSEIRNRNTFQSITSGGNLAYSFAAGRAGVSAIGYFFSHPLQPSGRPYDIFSVMGKRWFNVSANGEFTFRNIHVFGEVASDRRSRLGCLVGMLASLDRSVDFGVVFRKINRQFQSFNSNSFTEGAMPSNETGLFTGISVRPSSAWKIDAYADVFKFPWLLFRTNAPTYGAEYLLQVEATPGKMVNISLRYKRETRERNASADEYVITPVVPVVRQMIRYDVTYRAKPSITVRNRIEACWLGNFSNRNSGFLAYADLAYKPFSQPVSGNIRVQYFETDSYDSRIYAAEQDVQFASSTPAFFDKGFRLYLNLRTDVSRSRFVHEKLAVQLFFKYSLTHFFELDKIGSEMNEIQGRNKADFKCQVVLSR